MKNFLICLNTGMLIALFLTSSVLSQDNKKLAQTGFQFLSVVNDAHAAAIADAVNSLEIGSSALFFNPAGMANMTTFFDASISRNEWIADITHHAFSLAFSPSNGHYGVIGVSVQSVDYGEVLGTIVSDNDLGYEVTGDISPSATAIGVGYAKAITDRFAVGGQIKYVTQDLGKSVIPATDSTTTTVKNELTPFAFDFGTQFKTGFKSLTFGMSVRNFSEELRFHEEGFQMPLVFTLGISANVADFVNLGEMSKNVMLSIDATHFRSHPEQLKVGLDYKLMDVLSLRGGYIYNNDEDDFTFGAGISQFGFKLDYAYTPFGAFDKVQRFTARFSF